MHDMLDTNSLIYVLNARTQHQAVLDQFNKHDPRTLFLSSIALAELRFGVEQSQRRDSTHSKLKRVIAALNLAPFEERAARAYGTVRALFQAEGTPIGPLDTLIAGHTLSLGLTLVSNNTREFSRVPGLRIENWISA